MRKSRFVLILILLLAAGLRFYHLGDNSFDVDELASMESSTGRDMAHMLVPLNRPIAMPASLTALDGAPPAWKVWEGMRLDNHPPLYFLLLRLWRDLFGSDEMSVRLLSVIFSLAAVVLIYLAVGELSPDRPGAALWAAALTGAAPLLIHYGRYVRMYSLLEMFSAGALLAMVRLDRKEKSPARLLALGLCALGAVMTHYFAVAIIAAGIGYALARFSGSLRRWTLMALLAACVLFAMIWGPFLWQQRHNFIANNAWQFEPASGHVSRTMLRAGELPIRIFTEASIIPGAWALLGLLAYVIPLFFMRRRPGLLLVYLWALLPCLLLIVFDLLKSGTLSDEPRYAIAATPAAAALVALLFADRAAWLRHMAPGLLALACVVQTPGIYAADNDFQRLATFLQNHQGPDDAIVFCGSGDTAWHANVLLLVATTYAPHLPGQCVLLTKPPSAGLSAWLADRHHVWQVTIPGDEFYRLGGNVTVWR